MKKLTINELKYLGNLIRTSGDMGCKFQIGSMTKMVDCNKLESKIRKIIADKENA